MLNEINCNPKKWRKSKKKPKSFNLLITEKINKTGINVGARTELERYELECEQYGHNVRNTVTNTNSWFLKFKSKFKSFESSKIKFKKTRKTNTISFFNNKDIENTTIHPRQKTNPPEQIKKRKSRNQTYETLKHFAKKGQKNFRTAFIKKINCFSKI